MDRSEAIVQIRYFNRIYAPAMHLLDADYLGTGHAVTDARILFEIRDRPGCTARDVREAVSIDKGYLSRVLTRFERDGLVRRESSPTDGRAKLLFLTSKGTEYVQWLVQGGTMLVQDALGTLTDAQAVEIATHTKAILDLLTQGHAEQL